MISLQEKLQAAFRGTYESDFLIAHDYHTPIIYRPRLGEIFRNIPDTSDYKAYKGESWITYWASFAHFRGNHLKCTNCKKDIYVDVEQNDCIEKAEALSKDAAEKVTPDTLQAEGGHVYLPNSAEHIPFITPLCHKCNDRTNTGDMEVSIANSFIEEIR